MSRALGLLVAWLVLCANPAAADSLDANITQLESSSYKVRLAATLALAKSRDNRAVIALARAVRGDQDATIRRVAALALEKMVDARTETAVRETAIAALELASSGDRDPKVRETTAKALRALAGLRRTRPVARRRDKPEVFVNIDPTTDHSKQLPSGAAQPARPLILFVRSEQIV
ncbi:MAG: HEAT repeat domain-containing protein, partial [Kofleriaceae bacterium]